MRFQNLVSDMRRVIDLLTTQEQSFKSLSDSSIAEYEATLEIRVADLNEDGTLKEPLTLKA